MWPKIPSSTVEKGGNIGRVIIHQKRKPTFREKVRPVLTRRGTLKVFIYSSFKSI